MAVHTIGEALAPLTVPDSLEIAPFGRVVGYSARAEDAVAGRSFALYLDGNALAAGALAAIGGIDLPTRFDFTLPATALDGEPHLVEVFSLRPESEPRSLGTLEFRYGESDFARDLDSLAKSGESRGRLLERVAAAGRLDLLQMALQTEDVGEDRLSIVMLLLRAFVKRPTEAANHPLRELYDLLWRELWAQADQQERLLQALVKLLQDAEDEMEKRVADETPLRSATLDFVVGLLQRAPATAASLASAAKSFLALRRPALAWALVDRGLTAAPSDADLQALRAKLLYQAGRYGAARKASRQLLAEAPNHGDAKMTLSRSLQGLGQHLASIDVATSGRGIGQGVVGGKRDTRIARASFPLGWWNWALSAYAGETSGPAYQQLSSAIALAGGALPDRQRTYSIAILPPRVQPSYHREFQQLAPFCCTIGCLEDEYLGGANSIGEWILFLRNDCQLDPKIIAGIHACLTPAVGFLRVLRSGQGGGSAEALSLRGLFVRRRYAETLGQRTLQQADEYLQKVLRKVDLLAAI